MSCPLRVCAFAFIAATLCTTAASASNSEADALFEQGRVAASKGDCASALPLFRRSQQVEPAAGTLMNIAVCEESLGQVASAWTHLQQAITALAPNDDRLSPAKERSARLQARLPKLRVVRQSGAPEFTKVTCDGTEWAGPMLQSDQPVDPGRHQCVVTAPGRASKEFSVTLSEAQQVTLNVEPGPPESRKPQALPTSNGRDDPNLPRSTRDSHRSTPWLGYALTGIGAVGIGVGAVTGAMVFSKKSTIEERCPNKSCDPQGREAIDSVRTLSTISTVGFAVGAVGLAGGLYLLVTGKDDTPAVAPVALPGGGAVTWQGAF